VLADQFAASGINPGLNVSRMTKGLVVYASCLALEHLDDLGNLPSPLMMAEGAREEWLTVGFELRVSHRRIIQNSQGKELSAPGAIEAEVKFAFLPLHGFASSALKV
jgi:hypothetical protein